jgi:uncharacterized membrane protein
MSAAQVSDRTIERLVSVVLRGGVLLSATVVLLGGIYYLVRHGDQPADFHHFHALPGPDRIVGQIVSGALHQRGRSIIQTGILLLIATPIARVAVSLVGFALERDGKYVVITAVVLVVLLYSFISGAVAG